MGSFMQKILLCLIAPLYLIVAPFILMRRWGTKNYLAALRFETLAVLHTLLATVR